MVLHLCSAAAHIYFPIEGKRSSLATQALPSFYSETSVDGQPSPWGIKRSITGAMSHKMLSLTFALILLALSLSLATSNTAAQSRPRQVYPQRSDPSATRLRRAKHAKAGSPVKQIAEPYVDRLDKLLTDYLGAIQNPEIDPNRFAP
jgi:hypothetical protein